MKARKFLSKKTILILFLALFLSLSAIGLISEQTAFAQTAIQTTPILPKSNLEYYGLNSPIDTYSDDTVTAILQDKQLILYKDGNYSIINNVNGYLDSVKQIKRLDQNTLIFSSNGDIYCLDLTTNEFSTFFSEFNIGGNYFDFNEKYFVTVFGTTAKIHTFTDGQITSNEATYLDANGDFPITINENNQVFYIDTLGKTLCKRDTSSSKHLLENVSLSKMIANNEYVYYIKDNQIYRISVNGGEPLLLQAQADENHDLGKTLVPTSLAFRGNNLLITGDNAVQEFDVSNAKLEFTGFAIAKGKTAYNRISSTVKTIDKYKDTLAVLDGHKLSLITVKEDFDAYDRKNYNPLFANDLGGVMPDCIAIGKTHALMLYAQGTTSSKLRYLDLSNNQLSAEFNLSNGNNIIRDVSYQSGRFYVVSDHGDEKAEVYSALEGAMTYDNIISKQAFYADRIEADVFGNVYLTGKGKIYKFNINESYSIPNQLPELAGIKEIATDLGGGIFALTDFAVNYLDSNKVWQKLSIPSPIENATLQSMALDFDKKQVFLVYNNEEIIVSTQSLPNFAIDNLAIPQDFITTDSNANINDFKAYTSEPDANVYSIEKDTGNNSFKFIELVNSNAHYALITPIILNNDYVQLKLYALVGQDHVVLINQDQAVDVTPTVISEVPEKAFITTGVHGYYLPIIMIDDAYTLTDNQSKIRLAKEQEIKPLKSLTFLDKEYYFAEMIVDGITHYGYVPVDFTIEVLSQNFEWDKYTVERVNKTIIYSDSAMNTQIKELEDGTAIRLISTTDGVSNVAYETQSGWIMGYIKADSIKNDPSIAIRNILIIIAVITSICGTSTFFILRKRK